MTDIKYLRGKKERQFLFDIQLGWVGGNIGVLFASETREAIYVSEPTAFGGDDDHWSPEHLFLASISSCFMTTYLSFAKKFGFSPAHFECRTIGQIEMVEGHYEFTTINVYPKIHITYESCEKNALRELEKTQKNCLVSKSIKSNVVYHGQVVNGDRTRNFEGTGASKNNQN